MDFWFNLFDRVRTGNFIHIPISERELIETIRFEPEELDQIEQVHTIFKEKAAEAGQDPPSEASVIRTLVRLGIEESHRQALNATS